jgi:hypothetical protein
MLPNAWNGRVGSRSESITGNCMGNRHFVNVGPLQLGEEAVIVHYEMPRCQQLLNILDFHDAAFRLRVLGILNDRHVQLVLVFAERNIGRAIPRGDFKDM